MPRETLSFFPQPPVTLSIPIPTLPIDLHRNICLFRTGDGVQCYTVFDWIISWMMPSCNYKPI